MEFPKGTKFEDPVTVTRAAPGAIPKGGGDKAVVTLVKDGDTADVTTGKGSNITCRIDKIDAPETSKPWKNDPGQPYGDFAKKTLQSMIENKEITLRVTRPKDGYGRFGCQIEIEGKHVDQAMIQAGAAWLYRRYANDPELIAAEDDARKNRRGLWQELNPVNPEKYRHN